MNKKVVGLISALAANTIWGFTSITLRLLKSYTSDQILYYRIFVSFFICWSIILLFNRKELLKDFKEIKQKKGKEKVNLYSLIFLSAVFITLNWYSYIFVVNHINLKTAAFAYMVCPLITALGGFLLLKEDLSRLKFFSIGLACIAIITLATGSFTEVLCSVFVAFFYAFFVIIQRVIQNIGKLNMLGFQLLIALFLILPLFFIYPQPTPINLSFWIDITIVSVVFTIVPLLLSLYALESLPSSTVGILIYINPIVAFTVAFFYFHETIEANQILAYSLLVAAVILFNIKILKESFSKISKKMKPIDL